MRFTPSTDKISRTIAISDSPSIPLSGVYVTLRSLTVDLFLDTRARAGAWTATAMGTDSVGREHTQVFLHHTAEVATPDAPQWVLDQVNELIDSLLPALPDPETTGPQIYTVIGVWDDGDPVALGAVLGVNPVGGGSDDPQFQTWAAFVRADNMGHAVELGVAAMRATVDDLASDQDAEHAMVTMEAL